MASQKSKSELPKELPLEFLRNITDNFSDDRKLCRSPFGTLYKGIMDDGRVIGVKKLHERPELPLPADNTFKKEVQHIMALKHENIVELVGFCSEVQMNVLKVGKRYMGELVSERLLCYEHLAHGSLEQHLFGTKAAEDSCLPKPSIDWDTRFKIVKGVCQGLLFLHNLERPIIHMDLNSKNIWLGQDMVPKIGNFGLSRLFPNKVSKIRTRTVVGSFGYMAPEYLFEGVISAKADVYSLGLTIIEISTREKNIPVDKQPSGKGYIDKIRKEWTAEHISSKYRSYDEESLQQVYRCIEIGLKCVQLDPTKRPPIEEVCYMLNII